VRGTLLFAAGDHVALHEIHQHHKSIHELVAAINGRQLACVFLKKTLWFLLDCLRH
jgi:hypothetical protein